jgi:colanic acid/amylovoran biosynthesis glycosyltransferase
MKVGYVLKTYPRLSQTFIVSELLAHEACGLELEIFSLRHPKAEDRHAQASCVRAPVTYLGVPAGAPQPGNDRLAELLGACVRERGISHLHAHFATSAADVAMRAAALAGVHYTFTAHARDIFHASVDERVLGERISNAHAVVTVSEFNRADLHRRFGEAARRVRRIYNGLDLARFDWRSPREHEPLILAVGRLVEKKGFADLIDACAHLARSDTAWRCVIAGDGPLAEPLRAQIREHGLTDRVRMLGALPPAEVAGWMREAAVLAVPCVVGEDGDRDGLPTVLLEGMALGCPCVSTDVTGIPEIVHNDDTGLVVVQRSPQSLAGALERLLGDAPLRERLARNARRMIESEFDIHHNTARMRALFASSSAHAA